MPDRELSESARARIVELLELPADADSDAINTALATKLDQGAENRIAAAIRDGAILPEHHGYWVNAFQKDYSGTEQVLASLAPRRPPAARAPLRDTSTTQAHNTNPTLYQGIPQLERSEADAAMWSLGLGAQAGLAPPPKREPTTLRNEDGTPYVPKHHLL